MYVVCMFNNLIVDFRRAIWQLGTFIKIFLVKETFDMLNSILSYSANNSSSERKLFTTKSTLAEGIIIRYYLK